MTSEQIKVTCERIREILNYIYEVDISVKCVDVFETVEYQLNDQHYKCTYPFIEHLYKNSYYGIDADAQLSLTIRNSFNLTLGNTMLNKIKVKFPNHTFDVIDGKIFIDNVGAKVVWKSEEELSDMFAIHGEKHLQLLIDDYIELLCEEIRFVLDERIYGHEVAMRQKLNISAGG